MKKHFLFIFFVFSILFACSESSQSSATDTSEQEGTKDITINTDIQNNGKDVLSPNDTVNDNQNNECNAGEAVCKDDTTVQICLAGGKWNSFACPQATICIDGE